MQNDVPVMSGNYPVLVDTSTLNTAISAAEVRFALNTAKRGKAMGYDDIPIEVLQSEQCAEYLLNFFNCCFNSGSIPDIWSRGIINPILKDPNSDTRNPHNYRGITITSAVYKLFCSILNSRLSNLLEMNHGLCEEQNGFRIGRSTGDHLSSLSLTVETRLKRKLDSFAIFIDFSKAYDRINRDLLWHKLNVLGVDGKMLKSLKSLYEHVQCTVRINGCHSEWFEVQTGLKQGCILSPLLFNSFVNDLIHAIRALNCGVPFRDDDSLSILLYADDIVLLSEDVQQMQVMLNCLDTWCKNWGLDINYDKSKAIHFRTASKPKTEYRFVCGDSNLELVSQYKYLGVIFTEHLNFLSMSKMAAQSASRALGLLISKDKAFGGIPYECFTKCYNATVQATIDYSAPLWGTQSVSCISAVQNRACRYFLGVGRYAPNAAVNGDMGWSAPEHKQWICVTRKWCRLTNMADSRLAKRVFSGCMDMSNRSCKTWCYRVRSFYVEIEHDQICAANRLAVRATLNSVDSRLQILYEEQWNNLLNADFARRGQEEGGNKLRTYRRVKQNYATEQYVKILIQKKYRSAYAKFRCGVAPIKLETGRYGLNRVPVEERLCEHCNLVEDEYHVLMQCTMYNEIREGLFVAISTIEINFRQLPIDTQFLEILSNPLYYRFVSKAMYAILNKRRYAMLR